ncbi:D-lactate dehydrogenase (cytochrome) [Paucidesulfovibrio gracilis DSM 16080]|uniref:D-lactate dehydrogenase (Cytochrome) n=1 Tax=Paucidesulfovibrio gracilis DSM 16080 TaxID=1121449 RepID=A0A1T4XJW8_9BACT|nr:FAD-linked oxidase C-terminal domain-containing protein [Paucidesulfovibrio gracilis]SKA89415.1 D-lactate dehydrogenase (cytochrome) [Paucidesulfovibrio gracilis DSM 16080]
MSYVTKLTSAHRSFLEDLFKENVSFDKPSLRVYSSDASNMKGEVLAMVRPTCVEQVREFMRWADAEKVVVHPRGRGTSLSGGCVPTLPGIVVSMLGMDRILDISDTDFVATVEPGVGTTLLQAECEKRGMFYPPDPASSKATSIGGNVVTCAGGLRAVKYGVTRDYVLGCDVVIPGGKLLQLGGRTQKDVIGLDMTRFMVGSEGTLGLLTKLHLKLLPKPDASASLLVGYSSLDAALNSMGKVFAAGILPSAVEFMNETVLDILKQTGEYPWPDSVNSLLLFQVDGSEQTVPLEIARLSKQIDDALWRMQGVGKEEEDALWGYRRRVSAASYVLGPDRIGGDMAVPRGQILNAVRRFESLAEKNGKRLIAFGHAGDGNIHANLHYDASDADDAERTQKTHHEMDAAVLEFGGSISGEHGGGCLKDVGRQLGKDEHEMMRQVRGLFDPNGILNPKKGY